MVSIVFNIGFVSWITGGKPYTMHMEQSQADKNLSEDIEILKDGSWRMWALPHKDGFTDPGHFRFAEAHAQKGQVPVPVIIKEDDSGTYYGWLATDHDAPTMIYGHIIGFNMCFPYGPKAEEDRGNGRAVHLTIEALSI
jgi:hypothetical protein